MPGGLEAAHGSRVLARRLVRVFGTVVEPPMAAMFHTWHDLVVGCLIAAQLVRNHDTWDVLASLQQLAEELLRRRLVPAALHKDIEHIPILIDGSPQIVRLPVDLKEHFVQKPLVVWSSSAPSELIGIGLAELPSPLTDRFVGDEDGTLRQQFLNVPIVEAKAEVEPNRVGDDLVGEAKGFV